MCLQEPGPGGVPQGFFPRGRRLPFPPGLARVTDHHTHSGTAGFLPLLPVPPWFPVPA